jgi:hypothetical protein
MSRPAIYGKLWRSRLEEPIMYDVSFIFDKCGFGKLPAEIDRNRLFNVSYELGSGDIKLYVLDKSERFLYKISRTAIGRQYVGDDPEDGGDFNRLCRYLDRHFDPRQIVIDAVEEGVYYVYLDDAGVDQTMLLLNAMAERYLVSPESILATVNQISGQSYDELESAATDRVISLVKIPFDKGHPKLYARPFLRGPGVALDATTRAFLAGLYACEDAQLDALLGRLWVAKELGTDRMLVVAQRHSLLHCRTQVRTAGH